MPIRRSSAVSCCIASGMRFWRTRRSASRKRAAGARGWRAMAPTRRRSPASVSPLASRAAAATSSGSTANGADLAPCSTRASSSGEGSRPRAAAAPIPARARLKAGAGCPGHSIAASAGRRLPSASIKAFLAACRPSRRITASPAHCHHRRLACAGCIRPLDDAGSARSSRGYRSSRRSGSCNNRNYRWTPRPWSAGRRAYARRSLRPG